MRLINLNNNYSPLVHDMIKTATVLLVVEFIQFYFLGQKFLDSSFTRTAVHQLIGLAVFYFVVDGVVGAGAKPCCAVVGEAEPEAAVQVQK